MMILMLLALSLSASALVASIFAYRVAVSSSDRSLNRQLREHSAQLALLEGLTETHSTMIREYLKRERARENMRKLREMRKATEVAAPAEPGTEETRATARRELNRQLAIKGNGNA